MKSLIFSLLIVLPLLGETMEINNFKTDIFSKNSSNLKKIKLDLVFDINSTLPIPKYKLKDALNIVVSSFFIENLFTSQTKEKFKEVLKSYLKKKHNISVENIYISDIQIVNQINIDDLIKRLKDKKIINNNESIKK